LKGKFAIRTERLDLSMEFENEKEYNLVIRLMERLPEYEKTLKKVS